MAQMLRTLIGSSNVHRTYKHGEFPDYPQFKLVKCTKKEVFAIALDEVGKEKGEVIISVIENFLCDAVRDLEDPEAKNTALEKTIQDYLGMVRMAAIERPEVKFALAQPTLRPLHQWFTKGHEAFCKKIAEGIRIMDLGNVGKIDAPIKMSQIFEQDGVHLTPTSGRVYVNALLYNADAFFSAEIVNLGDDGMDEGEDMNELGAVARPNQASRITSNVDLEVEIANIKDDIIRRRVDDCLVTARIREELDHLSNTRKEDRIIVTGLTSRVPRPVGVEEGKKWLKDLVGDVLNQVEVGSSNHILNVMQGWKGAHNIQIAEVRMDSGDLASKIRKQFAAKKGGS